MADYPQPVMAFRDQFRSEADCRAYLVRLRWPEGVRCPDCLAAEVWPMQAPFYRCQRCGYDFTATAGTLFADTHKPLRVWFEAVWHITSQKSGVSALGLQRALGLGSYRTAWTWLHKLRRAMVRPGRDRLAGIVEIDETFIGGEVTGSRGRGALGKSLVLIAAQIDGRRLGRIRLQRIADASIRTLQPAIAQMVATGAEIHTDGWRAYGYLAKAGYTHRVIRADTDTEVGGNLLPHAHQVASLLKRWLLGTHQGAVTADHLDYYLDEFTFRFNRRTSGSRGLLFHRLMQQAVALAPVHARAIRGGRPLQIPAPSESKGNQVHS
jgi:transposase-like protein